jgi:hypothetical protein
MSAHRHHNGISHLQTRNVYFNRFAPLEEPTNQNILNLVATVTFRIQYTVFLVAARMLESYIGRCTNLRERERKAASAPETPC